MKNLDHIEAKVELQNLLDCSTLRSIQSFDALGVVRARRVIACLKAMEGIDDPAAARIILDEPQTQHARDAIDLLRMCRAIFQASLDEGTLKWDALERIDALLNKVQS